MPNVVKHFGPYDNTKVRNFLPHREPFLFVDKIIDVSVPLDENKKLVPVGAMVVGEKKFTIEEPFFKGHFPNFPITPGVILVETIAQMSSFAMVPWQDVDDGLNLRSGSLELRLAGVESTRFRKPVLPGDTFVVTGEVMKQRGSLWWFKAMGAVNGVPVVDCEFLASCPLNTGGDK